MGPKWQSVPRHSLSLYRMRFAAIQGASRILVDLYCRFDPARRRPAASGIASSQGEVLQTAGATRLPRAMDRNADSWGRTLASPRCPRSSLYRHRLLFPLRRPTRPPFRLRTTAARMPAETPSGPAAWIRPKTADGRRASASFQRHCAADLQRGTERLCHPRRHGSASMIRAVCERRCGGPM